MPYTPSDAPSPETIVQIELHASGWNVHYLSGPRAELIMDLFGTHTLPLPYGATMPRSQAYAEFARNTEGFVSMSPDGIAVLS